MYTSMFRKAMLGDTATLNLDFTTGVLDSRLTFTRASTATYINSSGYVTTAAANVPRFDYSPTNIGEPRGLLIEGQATNIIPYSNQFESGGWYKGGTPATLTSNYAVGPDGVTGSAWRFQGALTNSVFATPVANGGAAHVVSIYAKSNTGFNQTFTIYNGSSGTTCTATSVWQRFVVPVAGTWGYAYFGTLGANQDILIWGAQSELGTSGASSYIPTGASQVTRNADKMSMADISTMQWNQTAGTFSLHMDVSAETNTSSFPTFMGMYTATPVRVVRFRLNNSSGTNPRIGNDIWTSTPSVIVDNLSNTRPVAPTAFKFAVSLSNTGQTMNQIINGGTVVTTSGTGTMETPTKLLWNTDPSAGDTEYFPIHMRSLKYYPTALTAAQLQTLTTP